jgi:hypothetical protein
MLASSIYNKKIDTMELKVKDYVSNLACIMKSEPVKSHVITFMRRHKSDTKELVHQTKALSGQLNMIKYVLINILSNKESSDQILQIISCLMDAQCNCEKNNEFQETGKKQFEELRKLYSIQNTM